MDGNANEKEHAGSWGPAALEAQTRWRRTPPTELLDFVQSSYTSSHFIEELSKVK